MTALDEEARKRLSGVLDKINSVTYDLGNNRIAPTLIQRGRGTGPMKPQQPPVARRSGANSGSADWKMRGGASRRVVRSYGMAPLITRDEGLLFSWWVVCDREEIVSEINQASAPNPATHLAIVTTLAYWPRICACPRA